MKKDLQKKPNAGQKQPAQKHSKIKQQAKPAAFSFQQIIIVSVLSIITLIAFYPCINNGFTNWDDPSLIIDNLWIRHWDAASIKRIFTKVYAANSGFMPLHIFSYLIEYQYFGLDASGYHLVSVLMHLINVVLVFGMAKLISKNITVATITSLLFAVTPMRVESVAWAAERKDMLYAMFFFAAVIFYLMYVQQHFKTKHIVYAFVFYVLSILSKTMAVALVPVMFLIDFYYGRKITAKVFIEKIPFFILAVILGIVSVQSASSSGTIDNSTTYSTVDRMFFACQNLLMYVGKSLIPYGLKGYYQYPDLIGGHIPASFYISGGIVLILAALVFFSIKKNKLIFLCAGFFVSTTALILMLLPVGPTLFSERYSYVPSTMLYFLLATGLVYLINDKLKSNAGFKYIIFAVVTGVSIYWITITRKQCEVWKDSFTFWTSVIDVDPKVPVAYNNRGNEFKIQGDLPKALSDYQMALQLKPDYLEPNASLGDLYRQAGKYDSAFYYLQRALQLKPGFPQALINRGIVYAILNKTDSSMLDFNAAIKANPDMLEAFSNRGNLYCMLNKRNEGIADYSRVIEINPDFKDAYINRGRAYYLNTNYDSAINDFNMYYTKGGKDPDASMKAGLCYAAKRDTATALKYIQNAKDNGARDAEVYLQAWGRK